MNDQEKHKLNTIEQHIGLFLEVLRKDLDWLLAAVQEKQKLIDSLLVEPKVKTQESPGGDGANP